MHKRLFTLIMFLLWCYSFSICSAYDETLPFFRPENLLSTKTPTQIMQSTIVPFKNAPYNIQPPKSIGSIVYSSVFYGDKNLGVFYRFVCNEKNEVSYITIRLLHANTDKTFYVDQILRNVIEPKPSVNLKENDTTIWRKIREALNNSAEVTYITYPSPNKKNTYYISSSYKGGFYEIDIAKISPRAYIK